MAYELAATTWGPEEVAAAERVLQSGWTTMGANVFAFEKACAQYFGRKYAVMANSGSSANLIAVASLFFKKNRPLRRGDEVIVPAISWATTYHPLQQYGLKLRFVDVELDTLNLDVSKLEAALTPRTRMICVVSILGNPAALDVVRAFADKHDLYVFEDNCESMDAELAGRKCGAFGDVSTLSFFFSHHISTMEGGMVLTDDVELHHLLLCLRAHGWTRDVPSDSPIFEPRNDDFFEAYRFILPGYNVRPLEISGAIGLEQLKKLPGFTAKRRENWAHFKGLFDGDNRFITQRENGKSSAFSFTIVLNPDTGIDRKKALAAMKAADIKYRIITGGNFLRHDAIRFYDYEIVGTVKNADTAHDWGFFVGNHPVDLRADIDRLHAVLNQAVRV